MKLAIFSDTHGNAAGMLSAVRRENPDILVHLGDFARDGQRLALAFPELPLYAVSGNCDLASGAPEVLTFLAGQVTVFATHGHRYGVKYGLDSLCNAAHFSGASLALFGHTHIALCRDLGGLTLLNPGTAGMGSRPTYAVVEISENGGAVPLIRGI